MSPLLIFLLVIHGLIHFMGLAKAFKLAEISALSREVSKPWGILWGLAGLLLLISALGVLFFPLQWWMLGWLAVLLSQILIFSSWRDARFGTLANLLILIPLAVNFGQFQFVNQTQTERQEIQATLRSNLPAAPTHLSETEIQALPPVIQKWLRRSGLIGTPLYPALQIRQSGEMRTHPEGAWMPFQAEQLFRTDQPAFLWQTRVEMMPGVFLVGRDWLWQGKGQMSIKALALLPVVNAQGPEIDQGSFLRYLGEMIWFPAAVLQPWLKWEALTETSVRATLSWQHQSVSGVFEFSPEGDFRCFEALRYYGDATPAKLEKWRVEAEPDSFQNFGRQRMASRYRVIWKLKSGDFLWLKLKIETHESQGL
ncbi:hypothetical protein COW64_05455 [bacterium (Candidatus Blackallbacteria) CG18_big_fil_WC_8_21_14_2_50_49_26]|nr:MAG: hypothetical protein COW64_05455 [bacterium (Candidatus Blackallbacteria) CG18_big_fil_WC_8_21_14_2_50_49_26]